MNKYVTTLAVALAAAACAPMDEAQVSDNDWEAVPAGEMPPPAPLALTLDAPPTVTVGETAVITVSGATAGDVVGLYIGQSIGPADSCPPAFNGDCIELQGSGFRTFATADATGTATFDLTVPGNAGVDEVRYLIAGVRSAGIASNLERMRTNDGSARLRVVHGSPDAPPVDIYANGALLVPDLDYAEATAYVDVPAGTYAIDIRAAGAPANSTPAYSIPALPLDQDVTYTAIAAGLLGSTNPDDQFRVLPIVDDWGSPAWGFQRTRIVHASPFAPTVDIDVGNDGSSEIPALDRFADTGTEGVQLPAGVSLQVGVAGSAFDFTVPGLADAANYTVIALGDPTQRNNEEDAFGLLALDEDGVVAFLRQNPSVYVLHASPDAPAVDVLAGGALLVDDLDFRELSGRIQVPPGSYDLDIYDETQAVLAAQYTTPMLMAGNDYLAIAGGFLTATPAFDVFPLADATDIDETSAVFQAFHGSPDAPPVRVGVNAAGSFVPLTGAVAFGDATDAAGIAVAPGTYDVAIDDTSGNILFDFTGVSLVESRLFLVANGEAFDADFGVSVIDASAHPWTTATLFPDAQLPVGP